jgi:hypothetical protein
MEPGASSEKVCEPIDVAVEEESRALVVHVLGAMLIEVFLRE